jgi:hypothetical protein
MRKLTRAFSASYPCLMGRAQNQPFLDAFAPIMGERRGADRDEGFHYYHEDETERREAWYLYEGGPLHREDGPALIIDTHAGNEVAYYLNGELHREDGPAYEYVGVDGTRVTKYYLHGVLHRERGPALTDRPFRGTDRTEYRQHGELHRGGGLPALVIEPPNTRLSKCVRRYFIRGRECDEMTSFEFDKNDY